MNPTESAAILLIIANVLISYKGFRNFAFYERHLFETDGILKDKQYSRLLTSGFLHANWMHLIFNMLALYSFGKSVGYVFGIQDFLLIYFGSLLAGNLMALYIHRNHGDYRAIGASGAVSGIIFSSIAIFPASTISFPFIPIGIPAWLFGICYMLVTIYGIRAQYGSIGHEAHLGGAIAGVLLSIGLEPLIFKENWLVILAILLPCAGFMTLLITRPEFLLVEDYFAYVARQKEADTTRRKHVNNEQELDRLLEKVHAQGMGSLNEREKKALQELSKKLS